METTIASLYVTGEMSTDIHNLHDQVMDEIQTSVFSFIDYLSLRKLSSRLNMSTTTVKQQIDALEKRENFMTKAGLMQLSSSGVPAYHPAAYTFLLAYNDIKRFYGINFPEFVDKCNWFAISGKLSPKKQAGIMSDITSTITATVQASISKNLQSKASDIKEIHEALENGQGSEKLEKTLEGMKDQIGRDQEMIRSLTGQLADRTEEISDLKLKLHAAEKENLEEL